MAATRRRGKGPTLADDQSGEVEEADPPRFVGTLAVVNDEPYPSPLSTSQRFVPFRGLRKLTLEDGSMVVGCADCDEVGTRGEIRVHRTDKHGAGNSYSRRKTGPGQPLLPPDVAALTVGELVVLGQDADHWSAMFTDQQELLEQWKERCAVAETKLRKLTVALERAGFSAMTEE